MRNVTKPRIVLDTTVINHLENEVRNSEPLMRGLELGYDVRLPAMVVDEILATKTIERRNALLS
jgi:rRNA-processing protein FCF1